jgi:hypothetical protein
VSIKKPKFEIGDEVMVLEEIINPAGNPGFYLDMNIYKGKAAIISEVFPVGEYRSCYNREPWYRLEGISHLAWTERWLKLVKKRKEPKFKEGEWVKLKEEVDSVQKANELASNPLLDNMLFIDMMPWKNKFMKIKDVQRIFGDYVYLVKDNTKFWHENWLEKVE